MYRKCIVPDIPKNDRYHGLLTTLYPVRILNCNDSSVLYLGVLDLVLYLLYPELSNDPSPVLPGIIISLV